MIYGNLVPDINIQNIGLTYKFKEIGRMPFSTAKKLLNNDWSWKKADEQTKIAAVLAVQRSVNKSLRIELSPVFYDPNPLHPYAAGQAGLFDFDSGKVTYNLMYLNAPEMRKCWAAIIAHESRHCWQKNTARRNRGSILFRKIRKLLQGGRYSSLYATRLHDFYYIERDANKFAKKFCRYSFKDSKYRQDIVDDVYTRSLQTRFKLPENIKTARAINLIHTRYTPTKQYAKSPPMRIL